MSDTRQVQGVARAVLNRMAEDGLVEITQEVPVRWQLTAKGLDRATELLCAEYVEEDGT